MIVCCCTGESEREVRALVRAGARDLDRIGEATGAGACCGGCRPLLQELIRSELRGREESAAQPLSCAFAAAAPRFDACTPTSRGT